jgi:hypothetical protein
MRRYYVGKAGSVLTYTELTILNSWRIILNKHKFLTRPLFCLITQTDLVIVFHDQKMIEIIKSCVISMERFIRLSLLPINEETIYLYSVKKSFPICSLFKTIVFIQKRIKQKFVYFLCIQLFLFIKLIFNQVLCPFI